VGLCQNSRLAIARLPQETLQIHLIQTVDSELLHFVLRIFFQLETAS
jgi:hypothetical protein